MVNPLDRSVFIGVKFRDQRDLTTDTPIIVSRVSGMPFAEFEAQRIFAPLGMAHTSWRDDSPHGYFNCRRVYGGIAWDDHISA